MSGLRWAMRAGRYAVISNGLQGKRRVRSVRIEEEGRISPFFGFSLPLISGGSRVMLGKCVPALLALGLASAAELPEAPAGKAWKQVWGDEFDGKEIDTAKWDVPDQKRRDHWWRAKSAFLDGKGHLVLRTEQIDGKYYSPCVRTRGKYEKAFGFFTARCKVPKSEGHWSAFWLYADAVNRVGDDGRDGTEIDIFEWPWRDGRVQHALHWDGYGPELRSADHTSRPPGVTDGDWHTYSLWWSPEEYVFYVDGKEVWRTQAGGVCQVPLYLKLSTEIGKWAGDIRKAKLPDDFVVDYVRVYDLVAK